ncbi:AAA family ATPase [Haematospirillum jordaniae]|uniref:AAA family ATPase n=1 Tax=Haematospirillum jordaniae TaxID=1549855 RepID=UPI0014329994|nr:AAA family ATPase [Haematospirillum jordaniae]NKD46249.1 AAA family ATPase [Haematospirillum jordaniae]
MIVTVGNTKGGVGKSTIAFNLAAARALQGRRVWLVDGDPQCSSEAILAVRAERSNVPPIAGASYVSGQELRTKVKQQARKFDDVIIDCGGRDNGALRAALLVSHLLLIPFLPRNLDVWALTALADLVDEARGIRGDLDALAFLNCADPGFQARDNREAASALEALPQLTFLDAPVRRRKIFSNAAGEGLGVMEYRPEDPKATHEIARLTQNVFAKELSLAL